MGEIGDLTPQLSSYQRLAAGRGLEFIISMRTIVPIRDRRQHRRILTLKNFGLALLGVTIFFAGLTLQSDFRHKDKSEDYGRLFGKQAHTDVVVEPKKADIVSPPIEDQTSADPLLVSAQRREQWLTVEPTTTATTTAATTQAPGIVVTRQNPQPSQPLLSGGIFRQ